MRHSLTGRTVRLAAAAAILALFNAEVSARSVGDGRLRSGEAQKIEPFLGLYRGSFRSAVDTPWPDDDLNLNPCIVGEQDCDVHQAPLANILIELATDAERKPSLGFFYTREDYERGRKLDLLGLGCGSKVGDLIEFSRANTREGAATERLWRLTFRLDTGQCRIGSSQSTERELNLILAGDSASGSRLLLVEIFHGFKDANYLYTMEDGQRRRVRIMSPTVHGGERGFEGKYVCVEDAMGEYPQERCTHVIRTRDGFAIPLPTGTGGVSILFGANTKYSIDLRRTRGELEAQHYTGRFEHVE